MLSNQIVKIPTTAKIATNVHACLWSLLGCSSSDCAPVLGLRRLPLLVLAVRHLVRDCRRRRRRGRHLDGAAVVSPLAAAAAAEAGPEAQ